MGAEAVDRAECRKTSGSRKPDYVCGHSHRELSRLEAQGAFFEQITRSFLERAGIVRGMRVLDIGCGVGDLSCMVAEMVGPLGSVLGVDRAPEAVAAATQRAASRGVRRVEFRTAQIEELTPVSTVDALVGRFVLMHQTDPAGTLRLAARHVRPGGIVAMLESQMAASVAGVHSFPHSPIYERIQRWMIEVVRAAGAHPDMGLRLRTVFEAAGLSEPTLWLQARVEGGSHSSIYRYITESLRSLLAEAEGLGVAAPSPPEVEELEARLRDEVTSSGGVLTSPLVVGAWCSRG